MPKPTLLRLFATVLLLASSAYAGVVSGQVQTPTGGAVKNGTFTFALSQPGIIVNSASVTTNSICCYTDNYGNVVGIPDPTVLPVLTTNTGSGTLGAGTYYVVLYYIGAGGVSASSPEAQVVLTGTGTINVAAPLSQPTNGTGFGVAISTTSGGEQIQGTVTGWTQYQQTSALTAGASAPTLNTSSCSFAFNDQIVPTGTFYTVGLFGKNGGQISGFPQTWCTYGGAAGSINVSQGAPTGNCGTQGVYYPTPILAVPPNNGQQSISGTLSVTALSSCTQNGMFVVGSTCYPTIQSAINAVSSIGGTVWIPVGTQFDVAGLSLTSSHPVHLLFDKGTFAYSGTSAPAITCTNSPGTIIEGSGRGSATDAGTIITVSGTTVNGITTNGCDGIQVKNMEFEGPGSGSGIGIRNSSTRFLLESVQFKSFGSHGGWNDGATANANVGTLLNARFAYNGGNGFLSDSSNGQVISYVGADAACNALDGFKIGNSGNVFIATNTNGNSNTTLPMCTAWSATYAGYHFTNGATANSGSMFSDAPADETIGALLDSGADSNNLLMIGPTSPVNFSAGANTNIITSPAVTVNDSGSGNRYQPVPDLWNAWGAITLTLGKTGVDYGLIVLNNLTSGTLGLGAPSGALNSVSLFLPNPTVNANLLGAIGSGTQALLTGALGGAGCETTVTVAVSGATTSSHISWTLATDPSAVAGYGSAPVGAVQIYAWPTNGNINFKQCSAVAVTPGAMSVLWEVH